MTEAELFARSNHQCELCSANTDLSIYEVPPTDYSDNEIVCCQTCVEQLNDSDSIEPNHWRCLNESMWSTVPAVQVVAWRMLNTLKSEGWPVDLLDMMYLEEETLTWAKSGFSEVDNMDEVIHKDCNGVVLESGDTVVLTKDLNVKGAGFTAKRGTPVRNISLVYDNAEHIEGRVNGQQIVILTKYVKKNS